MFNRKNKNIGGNMKVGDLIKSKLSGAYGVIISMDEYTCRIHWIGYVGIHAHALSNDWEVICK